MKPDRHESDESWAETDAAFDRALDLEGDDQDRFLDSLPADRRRRVEALLASASGSGPLDYDLGVVAGRLLEHAGRALEPSVEGRRIGSWRLLERLGAGGMGVVHLAERADDAYHHRVALKVIRWELASPGLVERFVAERQILARLSHPHIATLIDGGVTDDGLPYLVLELVDGRRVDDFCDEEGLDLEARLRLMATICRAVDFAHRHMVVHRDLKPSNILIRPDGVPKLVDFGVAKLLDPNRRNDEPTRTTAMTPRYAAPEQRRGEPAAVAADVWALGVVLAEVLTGHHPFGEGSVGVDDQPDLSELSGDSRLRGDLANIVAQALRPEPEQRYRTAGELADDLFRFLDGHPVTASKPTLSYKLRKLVRRHRVATVAILAAHVVAAIGLVGILWQAREARRERDIAHLQAIQAEQVTSFLTRLFSSATPRLGGEPRVRELLDAGTERIRSELEDAPVARARLLSTLGSSYKWLRDYDRAEELLAEAVSLIGEAEPGSEEHATTVAAWGGVALHRGDLETAETRLVEALGVLDDADVGDSESRATILNSLGMLELRRGDPEAAAGWLEESIRIYRRFGGTELAAARANLARAFDGLGKLAQAEAEHRAALATFRQEDPDNESIAVILANLAINLASQGRMDEAMDAIRKSVALRRTLSDVGPSVAEAEANLAYLMIVAGRAAEAAELAESAAATLDRLTPGAVNAIATRANLGWALAMEGRFDRALPVLEQVVAELTERFGAHHPVTARGLLRYGAALHRNGSPAAARERLDRAYSILTDSSPSPVSLADVNLAAGALWCDEGPRLEGLTAIDTALTTFTELRGPDDWHVAQARVERARCLDGLGRPWDRHEVEDAVVQLSDVRTPDSWVPRRGRSLLNRPRTVQ